MDQQKYEAVMAHMSKGATLTSACHEALTTPAFMLGWLSLHPQGQILHAALLHVEGDARIEKSDRLHQAMLGRVDDGLVRTASIAGVEQAEIARLRKEGFMLRARAEKMLPMQSAPRAATAAPAVTSWMDQLLARETRQLPDAGAFA